MKLHVTELLFVGEQAVGFDEVGAQSGTLVVEVIGELATAQSVETHFEREHAIKTPGVVSEQLHESAFASAHGPEFLEEVVNVLLVGCGIVGREEDGAAGECGSHSVQRGFGFAFRSFRAGRELGIGAVGGELGRGNGGGL